jgi:hypothetical protein
MTHSAHRFGDSDSLREDYTIYARTSRFINRDGAGPKLKKILDIFLSEGPVNFGSSKVGKSYKSGLTPEDYADSLDNAYGVCSSFSNKDAFKRVLAKLKEEDIGISIVVSGLIDEVLAMADEVGLTPHTALLSLGIHGNKSLVPQGEILEISTMCGHSLVGAPLTKVVIEKVRSGKLTPAEGALVLAKPCPCGIFNVDRCERLLQEFEESKHHEK